VIKKYYALTKPGIIYGNILTTIAGYLFASRWHIAWQPFLATIIGTSFVIAAACTYNNYIDRGIDKKMARTKKRALVQGDISGQEALIFATVLGILGFTALLFWTNWWVVSVGIVGFIDYVVLYGITKRRGAYGTLVGSISGSTPVLAGYVAFTNHFDISALLVFLLMTFWQMPHFYAIAMFRAKDYSAAGIPVLPVVRSSRRVRLAITLYIVAFALAATMLTAFGRAGYFFAIIMLGTCVLWLQQGLTKLRGTSDEVWGRKMFFFSLKALLIFSVMLAIGSITP
jgi:protoheme IX farnesyltransferase